MNCNMWRKPSISIPIHFRGSRLTGEMTRPAHAFAGDGLGNFVVSHSPEASYTNSLYVTSYIVA